MAEIRPFRGVHYDQLLVGDLSTVICPPYDIITAQLQQELYQRSRYNFVRLESGRDLPQDTATNNKYTRAAATLEQWLEQGILEVDKEPAIYLHDHYFTYQGKQHRRRGITALVRLEEWDRMVIRPHEGTLAEPRNDRLSLLWACQANTSPILALFEDQGQVSSLLAAQARNKPMFNLGTDEESHNVWAITEAGVIDQICHNLANQSLYIADGHHRYESALIYRDERHACSPSMSTDEPINFVIMTMVDFTDPGLTILPPHRLVRGMSRSVLDELTANLKTFFEVEELPLSRLEPETKREGLLLFGLAGEHFLVLRLRDLAAVNRMMPYFHSELYKKLEVSVVDHVILEKLLGLSSDRERETLAYSYDKQDAMQRVLDGEYQLTVLLSPVKPETFKAIADAGDRMPRKSTYFYPKLPAGLIFNRLV